MENGQEKADDGTGMVTIQQYRLCMGRKYWV